MIYDKAEIQSLCIECGCTTRFFVNWRVPVCIECASDLIDALTFWVSKFKND